MRGLLVVFLLLFWSSPALPETDRGEAMRLAQHAASEPNDFKSDGHALDSKPIASGEEPDETGGEGKSGSVTGGCSITSGALSYYLCLAGSATFGTVERGIVTFTALLALSTLLLWIYTRRVANAAKIAAEHLPAVERAYVFGGPTDLFLLHDQASVRLAMQNYGKTPAVIRGWSVEFVAQEPHGKKTAYDGSRRISANDILEPFKLFSPPTVFRSEIPAPFFIIGYIVYDDVFRKSHTTRFCVGVGRDGKAAYAGNPAWNEYD
jgi:hypothetical protein